ncbi:spore gernimation protein GerPD [Ornithinibacillus sp. L9]|uniref:Spore gernimation protein GerPD n=1 Tax=Ornithinibacillus caprae TaxID=2678566 RepID=A0A6N8FMY6_9BACI|nr:spore gernimation protein GerPD [Ornithinibacillus caprae]MUK90126.1 spore gernimation protein GerPD [Ornithinibacillus caprae]
MNMEVHNWGLNVGNIRVEAVTASSVFLIGDNEETALSSFFDTPPESYTVDVLVPLAPPLA